MTTLFICWSGNRGRAAAGILARRLPVIVPELTVLVSTQIESGRLWSTELQRRLDAADAGLVCVTPEAVGSPWIHYEAGMLAANVGSERGEPTIFTYLLGVEPQELGGPLSAYQPAAAERDGTARLIESLLRFAGRESGAEFDGWWRELSDELQAIPPASIEEVVPEFPELFRSQTFVEPVPECTDQRWLGRRDEARETFARLDRERARVRAACRPAVADLYDELCRLVAAYAMDLKSFFITEKRFKPDGETGRLRIPPTAASAERRRADIKTRSAQLIERERAPLMEEAPSFNLSRSFAERKNLIHRKTAEIERGRPILAEKDADRAAFSPWAFDRIVFYLVLERRPDVSADLALRGVTTELEKAGAAPPDDMPPHYSLGPVKEVARRLAPDTPDADGIERALRDVERQIADRDKGGQMGATIAEIRRVLREPVVTQQTATT